MKVYGVVYLIWNMVNGKRYVGQTVQPLENRFNAHATCKKTVIGRAIRKYGRENFRYGVIRRCYSKAELDKWEKFYIVALGSKAPIGYNFTDGGEGTAGVKRSPEYLAKLSASRMGARNPRYGKKNTPEHQAKIVAANLGSKRTPETCRHISEALKGAKFTAERCAHISAAQRAYSPYKNLLHELDERNLSYAALARLLGTVSSIVSRKMTCVRNFTVQDRAKLEEIFGKPAEYLLERDEEFVLDIYDVKRVKGPYKNLLRELEAHKLSCHNLAELLNVSVKTIARKMRGERNFTAQDRAKLEEIFGKPAEYLLIREP